MSCKNLYSAVVLLLCLSCADTPADDALMRDELARARTMNQEYVPFTTDSTLLVVADYFDRHGTRAERLEARYLLGCAYRDMGEAPLALRCYQEAAAMADTVSDARQLIAVYGQMAELFDAQNLPADELGAMRKIQRLARAIGDSLTYIRMEELMTRPYFKLGDTARVVDAVWKANRLYTQAADSQRAVSAFATLAHIMVKRGQTRRADSLLREYEQRSGLFDSSGNISRGHEMYYYIKANYYLAVDKTDSAEFFLRRLLPDHYPADAYRGLMTVSQRRRQADSVVSYARLFEAAIDSQNNRRRMETIHQMAALYDYQRLQQKADSEALAAAETRSRARTALMLVGVMVAMACTLFIRFRRRKQEQLDALSQECFVFSGLLAKARAELDEARLAAESHDSQETEMKEKLEEKTAEVSELEDKLQQLERHYRSVTELASQDEKKNSEAVKSVRRKTKWHPGAAAPTAADWMRLTNQFRLDFPFYYSTLTKARKLSVMELRTAMLLMLDFKEGEIAVLLDVKPQRVTNMKKRVNMKLFDDESAASLVANIQAAAALS